LRPNGSLFFSIKEKNALTRANTVHLTDACARVQNASHPRRRLITLKNEGFQMRTSNARSVVFAVSIAFIGAACAPYSAPKQIQASNPTVTYTYHSDDELIQTNQLAATFCDRYQSVAHPVSFSTDASGDRVVVFECAANSLAGTPYSHSNLTYTYRTDKELMDVSRNAQAYCMNSGSSQVVSNIVSNGNGTKTVTFQCRTT
jgi:hypothetical protein